MEHKVVIALNIGSTHSGYAYQFRGDFKLNPIHASDNWGRYNKTFKRRTCLLLDRENRELIGIGDRAETKYLMSCEDGKKFDFHFFKDFKMILYREDFKLDSNTKYQAEDYSGRHMPFTFVMSKFIEGLRDDFFKRFERFDSSRANKKDDGTDHIKDREKQAETDKAQIKKGNKPKIDEATIQWVVTVPAIGMKQQRML